MQFKVEKKVLKILGATIRTFDEQGELVCRAEQKAFKLKEQIAFYADEQKLQPLFFVQARSVIDFGATYDITDPGGKLVASLRRKGLKSAFVQDTWLILDAEERQTGTVTEQGGVMSFLRRFSDLVAFVSPQKFQVLIGEELVGGIIQIWNPIALRYQVKYTDRASELLGDVLPLAIPNLITIIEGRQS